MPRFRIAWVIVAVAIAALDFRAIRPLMEFDRSGNLVVGALPMANVLIVGTLIGLRGRGSSPFLLGFEALCAIELAIGVAWISSFPNGTVNPYVEPFFDLIEKTIGGRGLPFVFYMLSLSSAVVMLLLPQVAFAFIGGFLFRKFMGTIRITRRPLA
jgi:hypothetical protein